VSTQPAPRETPAGELSPVKRAIVEIRELRAKLEAIEHAAHEPVAIVGIGCRFPGADGPDAYWRLLRDGVDAIREVPRDRWDADALYDPDPDAPGKIYTKSGGFLDRVDGFDAAFFGISPREAVHLDPQQRLLLEVAWEALEHAAIAPGALTGTRGGVFVGISSTDYAWLHGSGSPSDINAYFGTGNALSVAAGRLSYFFGLQGPAMSIDTACSSSLVAVHLAAQSLRHDECRVALAGGVNLMLSPESTMNFCRARMLAPDGRCKTFDAAADGYSRGEGAGIVVLKRLSHAIEDGNRVLAVVLGSAVNQDGRSSGLTVPNGPAQEALIRDALQRARVAPSEVEYVEAHGTGTSLGDPIELHALAAVLGGARRADAPIVIGSVKTNIGHLEAAAGIAGLIKVVLSLEHGEIPPHLHFTRLNPHVDLAGCPAVVPTVRRPWPAGTSRRIAGISAFGFSGTNAHVVIGSAPEAGGSDARVGDGGPELVVLSARTTSALRSAAGRLAGAIASRADLRLSDVAYTAAAGRAHLTARWTTVAGSTAELLGELRKVADGDCALREPLPSSDPPDVRFLCPDGAATPAGVVSALAGLSREFRDAFERCAAALEPHYGSGWRQGLDNGDPAPEGSADRDAATFAVQYAHGALWRSWGVDPAVVGGYGVGEYVAAAMAGLCSLDDAVTLMRARTASIDLRRVSLAIPRLALVSAADGSALTAERAAQPAYWQRARSAETDRDAVRRGIAQHGIGVTIALGIPGDAPADGVADLTTVEWNRDVAPEEAIRRMLGAAFEHGVVPAWQTMYDGRGVTSLVLPTYPFERQRYWVTDERTPDAPMNSAFDYIASAASRQAELVPSDARLGDAEQQARDLDGVITAAVLDVFAEVGVVDDLSGALSAETVIHRAAIDRKYAPTIRRWLRRLADRGLLTAANPGLDETGQRPAPDFETRLNDAKRRHGTMGGVLEYVERARSRAAAVLRGRERALDTLLPEGSFALAEEIYGRAAPARYAHAIVAAALQARLAAGGAADRLRVLEIGAGVGGATRALLPALPAGRGEYYVTDVAPALLERAREQFGARPDLRTGVLDICREPTEQGYPAGAFDAIVASGVLTGTRDLPRALDHAFTLAAPGGLIVIVEPASHPDWFDLGLLDDWQHADDGLRQGTPVVEATAWRTALLDRGATDVLVLPSDAMPTRALNQLVVIARAPEHGRGADPAAIRTLESRTSAGAADAQSTRWRERLADALPSEREDVLVELVRGHLQAVLRLDAAAAPDRRHRLIDLGVDSLMAVELRNRLEASLGLKGRLPSTLVFDYPSIDALVRHLDAELTPGSGDTPPAAAAGTAAADAAAAAALEHVADLSDAEVEALLIERLGHL
jgi:acyl transferase domain-containing protein